MNRSMIPSQRPEPVDVDIEAIRERAENARQHAPYVGSPSNAAYLATLNEGWRDGQDPQVRQRAVHARQRAAVLSDPGEAAFRATVDEALHSYPAPFAEVARRVLIDNGDARQLVDETHSAARLAATHLPWCQRGRCTSAPASDPGAHYHKGADAVVDIEHGSQLSMAVVCFMLPDGREPRPDDDGQPKVELGVDGDYCDLTPEQARTVAAHLLRLASLAESTPERSALLRAVAKDGAR